MSTEVVWEDVRSDRCVAGYPVHKVVALREVTNPHGAHITYWRSLCGAEGSRMGRRAELVDTPYSSVRKAEWCSRCIKANRGVIFR